MLHPVLGVLHALVAAETAGGGAGVEGGQHHPRLEGGPTGKDAARRVADVGAVEVEANAGRRNVVVHGTNDEAERPDLLQRLRKMEGQGRGLQRVIEEDRSCLALV